MSTNAGTIIIEGPPHSYLPPGAPPSRLEIHDLMKDRVQFSLYIQAITLLQNVQQDVLESYFQISGIHGLPRTVWDNASPKPNSGYCVHGSSLFPTWHRAYMSLYEQTLNRHAVEIAKGYTTDQDKWLDAAKSLRAPYWDWALHITPPPELYESKTLSIITKEGVDDNYPNPLLAYTFNPPLAPPYDDKQTFRAPGMINRLKSVESTLRNDVFKSLTLLKKWLDFSRHTSGGNQVANSLETIHNGMHNRIGGAGFMSDPSVASFDPIFYLHHINVDRQLALWQALNPNVWVGANEGLETDLTPFWNSQTSFHRSSGNPIRVWTDFGFSYPEFSDLIGASPEDIQRSIFTKVNDLYGPDKSRDGGAPQDYTEWFARVQSQTYALRCSYSIYLFFGDLPSSPSEWRYAENLVGVVEVFANPEPEQCPNCSDNIDSLHECIVYLTSSLQQNGVIEKSTEEITKYIKENLKLGIQKVDRDATVCPSEQLSGLDVRVESIDITFDSPRDRAIPPIPTAGEPQEHIHLELA